MKRVLLALVDLLSHDRREERAAERRWRQHNEEKRARGCPCGKPSTHVRYARGAVGTVPPEIWSCADHVNVNGWLRRASGPSVPASEYDAATLEWVSPAFSVVADYRASGGGA